MSDNGIELATAYVSIVPSMRGFGKKLRDEVAPPVKETSEDIGDELEKGIGGGTQRGVSIARTALSVLGSAVVLNGLNRARDAASELQQAVGGTVSVFGEASEIIDEYAENSAQAAGLSERAFRESSTRIGAVLQGLGFSAEEAADQAVLLTQRGADLAATIGGDTTEAVNALGRALVGEFDPLESYAVSLRASAVAAEAVRLELADSESNVSDYARAQATLSLLTERSAFAQGQFARESESAAGAAAIASATTEDAAASFGDAILPIYAEVQETLADVADVFARLPEPVQTGIVALAGIAVVAGPVSNVVGLVRSLRPATQAAATGLDAASKTIGNTADGLEGLYASAGRGSRALRGLAIAGGALAAVGIAATLYEIGQASNRLSVDIEEATRATTDELVEAFERIGGFAGGKFAEDFFRQLAEGGEAGAASAVALRDALADTGLEVANLDEILADVADGQARQSSRSDEGADALARFRTEAGDAVAPTEDFGDAVDETAPEVRDLADELNDAVDALRDYFDEQSSGLESQIAFRDVLRDLRDTQDEVAEGNLTGQERYDELAGSVLRGRDRILDFAQGLIETGTPLDEVISRVNDMTTELFDAADQAGLTTAETEALREQLGLMPEQVRATVETNVAAVTEDIKALETAVASALRSAAALRNSYSELVGPTSGSPIQARAAGGDWEMGKSYLIGEDGPEILTAGFDGFVTPMDVFGAAMPGGGDEIHLHVTQYPGEDQIGAGLRAFRHLQRTKALVPNR